MYTVYMHKCPNGKVYIGITSRNPKARWMRGNGYIKNEHFFRAIQKYGWENIEHNIIKENLTKKEAAELEINLIKQYNSNDYRFGYNMSSGGEFGGSGVVVSQETRKKLSEKSRGRKMPEYAKTKISESLKGHCVSEETKNKISNSLKAKNMKGKIVVSEETKEKLRIANTGKKVSEKTKNILREKCSGWHHTEEAKKKISEKNKKIVYCFETNKVYCSLIEAANELQVKSCYISEVCKGKRKMTKGLHFKFAEAVK